MDPATNLAETGDGNRLVDSDGDLDDDGVSNYLDAVLDEPNAIEVIDTTHLLARGTGGCSGSGSGPTSPWLLGAIALALFGRRRRRTSWAAAALAAAAIALTSPAHAQSVTSSTAVQIDPFEMQPAGEVNLLAVATNRTLYHLQLSAGLLFHYVDGPLELVRADDEGISEESLVTNQLRSDLSVAMGLFDLVEVGLVLPMILSQSGDDMGLLGFAGRSVEGASVGDLRLAAKTRLPKRFEGLSAGLGITLHVPTGDKDAFNSDGAVRFEPRLIADWEHDSGIIVAGNLGYQLRPKRAIQDFVSDDVLTWGLGAEVPIAPVEGLRVMAMVAGHAQLSDNRLVSDPTSPSDGAGSPAEALAGVKYRTPFDLEINIGGGAGLTAAVGSPGFRVFADLRWSPGPADEDGDGVADRDEECPGLAEDFDGFEDEDGCPEPDNDRDDFLDTEDACPSEPEDWDDFEDDDGCPEPDNDGDGILDAQDKCPNAAETVDGIDDEDGCPDGDADGDGLGVGDKCPTEAEDLDGFEDDDGCPDPDDDGDKVLDAEDRCPRQPETVNGRQDEDGCPDGPEVRAILTRSGLEVLGAIGFDGSSLDESGQATLAAVAALAKGSETITGVEVRVVVGTRRKPKRKDKKLAKARAASCLDALTAGGLRASAVKVRGKARKGEDSVEVRAVGATAAVVVGEDGVLPTPAPVHFKSTKSTKLSSDGADAVAELAELIEAHPEWKQIEIQAWATRGSARKVKKTSAKRAKTVRKALIKAGIAKTRLTAAGKGSPPTELQAKIDEIGLVRVVLLR